MEIIRRYWIDYLRDVYLKHQGCELTDKDAYEILVLLKRGEENE